MYLGSQIKEFLMAFARVAKNINFQNETEALTFAFNSTIGPNRLRLPWQQYQKHFDGIDPTEYKYSPIPQGCNVSPR